jgi:hypothetical protein
MRRPDEETGLEQTFAALRRQEQDAAPTFAALWHVAEERRRSRRAGPWRPLFLAATATAAGLLAILLALWRVSPRLTPALPAAGIPAISQWRPATDFLLQTPGRELLGEAPILGRGFPLDVAASAPSNPSTDPTRRPS